MDVEQRDQPSACQYLRNPICMTLGFMFGMIIGLLIHTERSSLELFMSVTFAVLAFHVTFTTSPRKLKVVRVIKKGS